jgi:hypothetical protein
MSTKKIPQTPIAHMFETMQEFDFKNMRPELKEQWLEIFMKQEKNHQQWAYNNGYIHGKNKELHDYDSVYNNWYKTGDQDESR